ncbi:MAG: Thiamine-monophosphate kinase [Methanonatronarchaeales archaeon]|nr:Thiamine-monophosphate kinase [Methanonatronarchaeales archaeon]
MDLEGLARMFLSSGMSRDAVERLLDERIEEVKGEELEGFSSAVVDEVEAELEAFSTGREYLAPNSSGVSMGTYGVGSRGRGDMHVHSRIADLVGETGADLDALGADDSGVVEAEGLRIAVTVDGMHSRLSEFPLLAGFHVARAALRDVYSVGARPVALLSDIHVADDGDVGKIFDFTAGVSAVAEASGVPLVTGSTLRVGGDMVIGERMTGAVGAVGLVERVLPKSGAVPGDVLLLSEGAGGGTISTTAIFNGWFDVVEETLNLDFSRAVSALLSSPAVEDVHAATDVTNGGLRGDVEEIGRVSGVKVSVNKGSARKMVNPRVLDMLESCGIDYLGLSLDQLLVTCPEGAADGVIDAVESAGVEMRRVGSVEEGSGAELVVEGDRRDFSPLFRESAYTPVKRTVGEIGGSEELSGRIDGAAEEAARRKAWLMGSLDVDG